MMHTVVNSFVLGQDPTYKILDVASFSKYLAVSSDKVLYIYSIRKGQELLLDLVKELNLLSSSLLTFEDGMFIMSKKTLYFLTQELKLLGLWKNVYSICVMNDYILACTKDKLSLVEFVDKRFIVKRETRSSMKVTRALKIDDHIALLEDKHGYYLLDVVTWELKQIYSYSRLRLFSDAPIVTVSRREIIITKEDQSIFFYKTGVKNNKTVTWSSKVINISAFQVYVMGALEKCIEIRNVNTGDVIQVIDIHQVSVITCGYGNIMYLCGDNTIWQFMIEDIKDQIKELQGLNGFEEAKDLLTSSDLEDEEKLQKYKEIMLEYAKYTLRKKDARKTLDLLDQVKASPKTCIDLFMGVSQDEIHLEKNTLLVLMDYLSRQRASLARRLKQLEKLNSETDLDVPASESAYSMIDTYDGEGFDSKEDLIELSGLVDTALFRIYLELNHTLLGSLFRVRNYIDQSVVERLLQNREKWSELMEFYKGKKLHEKALDVLKELNTDDSIQKMVHYLQNLDTDEHLEVIFEFAKWVTDKDVSLGIQVFTARYDHIKEDIQEKIVENMDGVHPDFAFLFLDHCIRILGNRSPALHNKFVEKYIDKLLRGADMERISSWSSSNDSLHGDQMPTLKNFLKNSKHYRPNDVLHLFPSNGKDLLLEKSIVLGQLKRHREALHILVRELGDFDQAERYCERYYSIVDPDSSRVFDILFELKSDDEEVIPFIEKYGSKMDINTVLNSLPPTVKVANLLVYFQKYFENILEIKNNYRLKHNLLKSYMLRTQSLLLTKQHCKIEMTEDRRCSICYKKIASNLFNYNIDQKISHTYCSK